MGYSLMYRAQCSSATIAIGIPSDRIPAAFRILLPKDECFQDSVA